MSSRRKAMSYRLYIFKVILLLCFLTSGCVMHEGRGIWVVRYRLNSPTTLDQIVDDAHGGKFNLLFVQVHGRGDAYYCSEIVPRSEVLDETPPEYDPLLYVLQRGHADGLQIHAWLNVLYVWPYPPPYPLSPQHVVNNHPEWLVVDEVGRNLTQYDTNERAAESSEGLYLDPANPLVRQYFREVCKEVTEAYDVDGIHLDFIRYPGARWGFNKEPVEAFMQRWGVDPRLLSVWVQNPIPERFITKELPLHMRWQYYYYSLWVEQKSRYVTELVRDVHQTVKSVNPQAILSAAVFPDPQVAYYAKGQDWPTWMDQGYLELIVPMAYHGDQHRVMAQMAEAKRRAQGRVVFAGLGAWIKNPDQIRQEVRGLKEIGVDGFSYFSYQGMMDQDERYIKQIKRSVHRSGASLPQLQAGQSEEINPSLHAPEPEDADLFLRSLKKQFFSLEEYQALLDQLGIDEDGLRKQLGEEVSTFGRMTKELYKKAIPAPDDVVLLPRSVELQVISCYVHPKDSPQTREEALQAVQKAYQRLMAGEDFTQVASEFSGGSGSTERFYIQDGWDLADIVSAFQEGEITPVIEVAKGYRIYKIVRFHPPEQRIYGELPWWLKRLAFQERFAHMVREGE
jgi:uncharacterized lipoprotein YddW (UPF0748 family)